MLLVVLVFSTVKKSLFYTPHDRFFLNNQPEAIHNQGNWLILHMRDEFADKEKLRRCFYVV